MQMMMMMININNSTVTKFCPTLNWGTEPKYGLLQHPMFQPRTATDLKKLHIPSSHEYVRQKFIRTVHVIAAGR